MNENDGKNTLNLSRGSNKSSELQNLDPSPSHTLQERQSSREGTDAPCAFRISSEGLPVILPHITKQILHASLADFKHLLQYKIIKFGDFVDSEFGDLASMLMMGCCVIVLRDGKILSESTKVDSSTIAIGCWKGRGSLSVMVSAIDCQELLERLSVRIDGTSSLLQRTSDGGEVQNADGIDEEIPEPVKLAVVS